MEQIQIYNTMRKPKNDTEQELLNRCFKEGLKNGWASGDFARADGDFITEEDCLNKNSVSFIDTQKDLINFFKVGNWCLGTGVIYKNLFFLEQINGGNEWAIFYIDNGKIKQFESYSIYMVLERSKQEFIKDLRKMINRTY